MQLYASAMRGGKLFVAHGRATLRSLFVPTGGCDDNAEPELMIHSMRWPPSDQGAAQAQV